MSSDNKIALKPNDTEEFLTKIIFPKQKPIELGHGDNVTF